YTSLLILLVAARFLVRRRAVSLERKYSAVLKQANALLREPVPREGNSGRGDAYQTAKRNFQLGAIAQKKETLEARHAARQGRGPPRALHRVGPRLEGPQVALPARRGGPVHGPVRARVPRRGRPVQPAARRAAADQLAIHLMVRSGHQPGRRAEGGGGVSAPTS